MQLLNKILSKNKKVGNNLSSTGKNTVTRTSLSHFSCQLLFPPRFSSAAVRKKGDTGANLIGILECRLDAILYRMKLAPTVFACRQLINHGHVKVNGKKVNSQKLKLPSGKILKGKERKIFETNKIKLDVLKSEKILGIN